MEMGFISSVFFLELQGEEIEALLMLTVVLGVQISCLGAGWCV